MRAARQTSSTRTWEHVEDTHQLLQEMRQSEPETEKEYNSTKDLKEGQLVLIKNHSVRAFQPKYVADYRIIKVINKNTVILASPDGRERMCNIHHIKPISQAEGFTSAFKESALKETIFTCQSSLQCRGNHIITADQIINASMNTGRRLSTHQWDP